MEIGFGTKIPSSFVSFLVHLDGFQPHCMPVCPSFRGPYFKVLRYPLVNHQKQPIIKSSLGLCLPTFFTIYINWNAVDVPLLPLGIFFLYYEPFLNWLKYLDHETSNLSAKLVPEQFWERLQSEPAKPNLGFIPFHMVLEKPSGIWSRPWLESLRRNFRTNLTLSWWMES